MVMINLSFKMVYMELFISGLFKFLVYTVAIFADTLNRPSPNRQNPFSMISNDPNDLEAMEKAERDTELVVLSDWDHLTSDEYMQTMEDTGYDILCEPPYILLTFNADGKQLHG